MSLGMQVIADELQSIIREKRLKDKTNDPLKGVRLINAKTIGGIASKYVYVGEEGDFSQYINDRNLSAAIYIGTMPIEEQQLYREVDIIRIETISIEELFVKIQQIFEKYNDWDEELTEAIMAHDTIGHIAEIGGKVFSNPHAIFDSSIYCIATSGTLPPNHSDPIWSTLSKTKYAINYDVQMRLTQTLGENLGKRKETALVKQFDGGAQKPFDIMMSYIFKDDIRLGNIGMTEIWAPITYGQAFLCEHYANRLGHWFLYSHSISVSEAPVKQLVTNLLDGKPVTAEAIRSSADWMGKKRREKLYLFSFRLKAKEQQLNTKMDVYLRYVEKVLSENKRANEIVMQYQDCVLTIIQAAAIEVSLPTYVDEMRCKLQEYIGKSLIGISEPFHEFEGIRAAYHQAIQAINIGSRLNPTGKHYVYSDYAIEHLISEYLRESTAEVFCHPDVKKLYDCDCTNGTEYVRTLEAYCLNMGNRSLTAELLHIHRNSLTYRLDKMKELLEVEELGTSDMLRYLMSCRMLSHLSSTAQD